MLILLIQQYNKQLPAHTLQTKIIQLNPLKTISDITFYLIEEIQFLEWTLQNKLLLKLEILIVAPNRSYVKRLKVIF